MPGGYRMSIEDMKTNPFINEETYVGRHYEAAAEIQRLRLSLLIHSRLYYSLDHNAISDFEFDRRARRLAELQEIYPDESKLVVYWKAFKDWDGTTGFLLPLNDPWVVKKTKELYGR